MRFDEFSALTGWNATRTSRAVRSGLFRDKMPLGSGNYYEYTERDVRMAQATDWIRSICADEYASVLLEIVAMALYEREDISSFLVLHPPVASFVDNAEQAHQLLKAQGGHTVYVLRFGAGEDHHGYEFDVDQEAEAEPSEA